MWQDLEEHYQEVESYLELLNEGEEVAEDADIALKSFEEFIDRAQIRKLLNDRDDHRNAILTIHPGAGGTESQDWANMLYRLYSRWCEKNGYKIKILDYQAGDEAGLKDVSIEISGDYVYGNMKAERGVHRLVRISPFDSNSKRHTSFASVFIYPVIDDDVEINAAQTIQRIYRGFCVRKIFRDCDDDDDDSVRKIFTEEDAKLPAEEQNMDTAENVKVVKGEEFGDYDDEDGCRPFRLGWAYQGQNLKITKDRRVFNADNKKFVGYYDENTGEIVSDLDDSSESESEENDQEDIDPEDKYFNLEGVDIEELEI